MAAKTVVISGAARGIGRACAVRFAKEGYNLSLCTKNNIPLLEELSREVQTYGAQVLIKACDVSKSSEVEDWIQDTLRCFGSIDVLVSNAGLSLYSLLVHTSEEDYDTLMNTNLKGAFLLSKSVYDSMVSQKSGSIIFVSSVWGKYGASFESVYAASKAGLMALSKSLAKELAPSKIRVNTVLAGAVETDMLKPLSEAEKRALSEEIGLQRIGTPEEVADAVYFLSSERASYITGAELNVDGGFY